MKNNNGFTLIELVIVISISIVLYAIFSFTAVEVKPKISFSSELSTVLSDIKNTQFRSMGSIADSGNITNHAVYFETNRYTMFEGDSYDPANTTNFTVNLNENIEFSEINLPSQTAVFIRGNGEILNYSQDHNYIKAKNIIDSEEKTITFNRRGIIVSVE